MTNDIWRAIRIDFDSSFLNYDLILPPEDERVAGRAFAAVLFFRL